MNSIELRRSSHSASKSKKNGAVALNEKNGFTNNAMKTYVDDTSIYYKDSIKNAKLLPKDFFCASCKCKNLNQKQQQNGCIPKQYSYNLNRSIYDSLPNKKLPLSLIQCPYCSDNIDSTTSIVENLICND